MKKMANILMTVFVLFFVIQGCKNDSVLPIKLSKSAVAGIWEGRHIMSAPIDDTVFIRFTFNENDTFTTADTFNFVVFTGVYSITGDSLIANLFTGADSVNFRFKASNENTRLEGKWNSTSYVQYQPIYLNKQ